MRRSAVAAARRWAVTERARNIHHVAVELPRTGDEFWALMQSDVHWDNPKCDRETVGATGVHLPECPRARFSGMSHAVDFST